MPGDCSQFMAFVRLWREERVKNPGVGCATRATSVQYFVAAVSRYRAEVCAMTGVTGIELRQFSSNNSAIRAAESGRLAFCKFVRHFSHWRAPSRKAFSTRSGTSFM